MRPATSTLAPSSVRMPARTSGRIEGGGAAPAWPAGTTSPTVILPPAPWAPSPASRPEALRICATAGLAADEARTVALPGAATNAPYTSRFSIARRAAASSA
jgi:hypothetical protein